MFKHMDDDESGRISYTELVGGLRSVLRLSKAEMPEARLRSLWVHLDFDASGFLTAGDCIAWCTTWCISYASHDALR